MSHLKFTDMFPYHYLVPAGGVPEAPEIAQQIKTDSNPNYDPKLIRRVADEIASRGFAGDLEGSNVVVNLAANDAAAKKMGNLERPLKSHIEQAKLRLVS